MVGYEIDLLVSDRTYSDTPDDDLSLAYTHAWPNSELPGDRSELIAGINEFTMRGAA